LSTKEVYTYYPNGTLKMTEYFDWNGSSWESDSYREEYFYDGNNNLTDTIISIWDAPTTQWKNLFKTTIGYNANKISSQTYYNWI
jgi:hypothetical protein